MKIKTGTYEHFKGKRYEVLSVGKHSETLEDFVVYRPLYEKRPLICGFGHSRCFSAK